MQVSAYLGWGDALTSTVSATASRTRACTLGSQSFPPAPVRPLNSTRGGEAFFDTTATAVGAVGFCDTTWGIVWTPVGYPTSAPPILATMSDVARCDNAAGGNPRRVGCVDWWYPAAVVYSRSANPSLAWHVTRAQNSGLPGGSLQAPLTRTTNQTVVDRNRRLAHGDAPSIAGRSCDEYPPASSNQGLAAGGTRRTFDGCAFSLPRATGPTGASVCMITASENSAQGGLHSAFFRTRRVLNGDPWRVLVGP